jgi:hypothetical protein
MLGTTGFIFVTFLLRSAFSTMYAVAFQLRDIDKKCHEGSTYCDATCYNLYTRIAQWMNFTPEFQLIIVLVSSPVAQLVALWGMTTKSTLHLMKTSKQDKALTLTLMKPKKKKKKKEQEREEEEEEEAAMA